MTEVKTAKKYILTFHLGAYFHYIDKNKNINIKIYDQIQHQSPKDTFVICKRHIICNR
jgi:hypothetical protein